MRKETAMPRRFNPLLLPLFALPVLLVGGCGTGHKSAGNTPQALTLLNVSYDPTREFYRDYNQAFAKYWKTKSGQNVTIKQSHGGSGKQARSVIDGLGADVVTLGIASDINAIQKAGDIEAGWEAKLPDNSTPYTSTVVFLVRRGNPKQIKDWADLVKPGVAVITPNPKTSSGGRWNYLAAWGYALQKNGGSQNAARAYVQGLYKNVPVLDSGARGSTNTFAQRGIGDVLVGWENDALLSVSQPGGADKFEVVYPSVSIEAEPPVAVVDKVAARHGTTALAAAYLKYLYSPAGQEIAARHFYRPRLQAVARKYSRQFPALREFTAPKVFGSWDQIQKTHFDDGGVFDQISQK